MRRESLASKGATSDNALIPPGTSLEYEFAGLASRRVAATGECPPLVAPSGNWQTAYPR